MKRLADSLVVMTNPITRVVATAALPLAIGDSGACGGGDHGADRQASQQSQVIVADGSSTVFPITEAVAEEFQTCEQRDTSDRGLVRHRRRIPKVLPRRDRHLERLASDQGRPRWRRAARPASTFIELPDRLRRHRRRRESEEHLGLVDDRCRAEEDLGAGRAGQGHALEPGPSRMARPGNPSLRRGRRLGHLRLLHRSDHRQDGREPRRLHVERRRQRHRAGRERRRQRARLLRLRLLRAEQGQAEAACRSTTARPPTAKGADRAVTGNGGQRHLPSAVAAGLHLREDQGARPSRGQELHGVLSEQRRRARAGSWLRAADRRENTSWCAAASRPEDRHDVHGGPTATAR